MERPSQPVLFKSPNGTIRYWFVYILSIIFVFHGLLVAYSNSTYMEQFTSPEVVGALYTIGSALSVFGFLFISRVLQRVGNVQLTIWLAVVEILALLILGLTSHPATAIVAFVVFLTLNPLIYLSIDIFSETLIGDNETATGSKRGLTLGLMSLASVMAPLTMGFIIGDGDATANLNQTYTVSAMIFLLFVVVILAKFKHFQDPHYSEVKVLRAFRRFWIHKDLRNVLAVHFSLQLFFSWMVIYVPLYLATEIGFGWDSIGTIIAFGLFAYVVFEYPIGYVADKYIGEKEMMAFGMVILAITAAAMSAITTASLVAWMVLMFISRIGASLVEATTESYFFKHTEGSDANVISFFRLTRPLAMVLGALLGSAALLYLPFQLIFVILGLAMVPGIFFTLALKDTK